MKTFLILLLLPFSLLAQIDYQRGIEFISTETPEVNITWIKEASKEVPFYLNQQVAFVNAKSDQILASRVEMRILHNAEHVKSFEFKVGEGYVGHIYTNKPIKLKKGDVITLHFKLIPTTNDESYVFSIFDQKLNSPIPNKSVSVTSNKKENLIVSHESNKRIIASNDLKRIRRNRTIFSIINLALH